MPLSILFVANKNLGDSLNQKTDITKEIRQGMEVHTNKARQFPEEKSSKKIKAKRQVISSPNVKKTHINYKIYQINKNNRNHKINKIKYKTNILFKYFKLNFFENNFN